MAIAYLWPTSMGAQSLGDCYADDIIGGGSPTKKNWGWVSDPKGNTYYRDFFSKFQGDASNMKKEFEYFEIVKNTITPEQPYIEFHFNLVHNGKDWVKGLQFQVAGESTSDWATVLQMKKEAEHHPIIVSTEWGALRMIEPGKDHNINGQRYTIAKWRFYPSEKLAKKGTIKCRLATGMDINNDNPSNHGLRVYGCNLWCDEIYVYSWDNQISEVRSFCSNMDWNVYPNGQVKIHQNRFSLEYSGYTPMYYYDINNGNGNSYNKTTEIDYISSNVLSVPVNVDFAHPEKTVTVHQNSIYRGPSQKVELNMLLDGGNRTKDYVYVTPGFKSYSNEESQKRTIKTLPVPDQLTGESEVWNKSVKLTWDIVQSGNELYTNGKWHIWRKKENESYVHLGAVGYSTHTYTDKFDNYDAKYVYKVAFCPDYCAGTGDEENAGYYQNGRETNPIATDRNISVPTPTVTPQVNNVLVEWNIPAINAQDADGNPTTYMLQRQQVGKDSWENIWREAKTISSSNEATKGSYEDADYASVSMQYYYRMEIHAMGKSFFGAPVSGTLDPNAFKVTTMTASAGGYPGLVKLSWNVVHQGTSDDRFIIMRKTLNSNNQNNDEGWMELHRLNGQMDAYSYDDVSALPGNYYLYRIIPAQYISEEGVNGEYVERASMEAVGFAQSVGVISGRVSYGTGVAVEGVRINLSQDTESGEYEQLRQFSSAKLTGAGCRLTWQTKTDEFKKLIAADKPFTIQFYVYLEKETNKALLVEMGNTNLVAVKNSANKYELQYGYSVDGLKSFGPEAVIPADKWAHVTFVYGGKGKTPGLILRQGDQEVTVASKASSESASFAADQLSFGGTENSAYAGKQYALYGHLDDIRIWDKALTVEDDKKNYDRILSGTEAGLKLYWPLDEGINGYAFDISTTGGINNARHATKVAGCISSEKVPAVEELALYGKTDDAGNYVIRGVPFKGQGVNYTVTPTMGIHKFAPHHMTRFVSADELNHSAVDFEDQSSFKVTGIVRYANTTYPVEGVSLYVDGDPASRNGKAVVTDANGKYEISVPIGDHYVSVGKADHVFTYSGRYPEDPEDVGTRHTFDQEMNNLDFFDETLSTFAGRVVGGDIEGSKPLGLGLSQNNLGKVELVLEAKETKHSLNAVQQEGPGTSISWVPNPDSLPVVAKSKYINSTAYRGSKELTNRIYIQTDPNTGEFVAKIPPIKYNLLSVQVINRETEKELLEGGVKKEIDASNVSVTFADSVPEGMNLEKFEWHNEAYRTPIQNKVPTFVVTQDGADAGAFGDKTFIYEEIDNSLPGDDKVKKTPVPLYTTSADGQVKYLYNDAAVFISKNSYTFKIEGYQKFVNADNGNVSKVPLAGTVVTITNALSSDQTVVLEDGKCPDNQQYKAGDVYQLKKNQCQLDSLGKFTYTWRAGLPNITTPYTRTLSMSYQVGSQTFEWNGKPLTGIVLGDLATGSNFVTAGPDRLSYILRDPSGSNSFATWKKGATISSTETTGNHFITDGGVNTITSFGFSETFVTGTTAGFSLLGHMTEVSERNDLKAGVGFHEDKTSTKETTTETTTLREISTSADPDYVGADGDLFIGNGVNHLFGFANQLSLHPESLGSDRFVLGVKDVPTFGQSFSTSFIYSQRHVKTKLIPDLKKLRKEQLTVMKSEADVESYINHGDKTVYLTTLKPENKDFGKLGTYRMVLPESLLHGNKPYCVNDTIDWINRMIKNWEGYMEQNEKMKVQAFEERDQRLKGNLSFDSGSSITNSVETSTTNTQSIHREIGGTVMVGYGTDTKLNKTIGMTVDAETNTSDLGMVGSSSTETHIEGNSYTLAESGKHDALTVDVLEAPDGFGPIFRTRGGRTSAPYEGEVQTEYYEPGNHVISDATMQIEKPQLEVVQPILSDVPCGRPANFELKLINASETADECTYILYVADNTNAKGARITMDGQEISDGRLVKLAAGATLNKRLQIWQTDLSVRKLENIEVRFSSLTDKELAAAVTLTARYVPSSSDVTLDIPKTTMNVISGDLFRCTIKDFDRTYENFKSLSLQYRYEGDDSWTEMQKYVMKGAKDGVLPIPAEGNINVEIPMKDYPDGKYTFRVVSAAANGNDEVTVNSEEIVVIKDMERPQLLGAANPADGILSAGDDISVRFNEDIRQGQLTKDNNFTVYGVRNNAKLDHSVAAKFAGGAAATTQLPINLNGKDFTVDLWMNISGDGNVLTHGTSLNHFSLDVDAAGKLVFKMGDKTATSQQAIVKDRWIFLTLNYAQNEEGGVLNAMFAKDAEEYELFKNVKMPVYTGNGRLAMGAGLEGCIHDVALWNHAREVNYSLSERDLGKSPVTPGLEGYWKMNEGHGQVMADAAAFRAMTLAGDSWYLNNKNFALNLDGSNYLAVKTGAISPRTTESYAVEFWFLADEAQQNPATLMQAGNGKVMLRTNASGQLVLVTNGKDEYTSKATISKNLWHHCLLNVTRGGSAILYVDGNNVLTVPASYVPALAGTELVFGAQRTYQDVEHFTCSELFKGAIDEIRFWNGQFAGKYLNDKRYERVDTTYAAGLVAYYPMEKKTRDSGGQTAENFNLEDASVNYKTGGTASVYRDMAKVQGVASVSVPALKNAPVVENLTFDFTASEREIFMKMNEPADILEGTTVFINLRGVQDMNGNKSTPITWSAYIRQNGLLWASDDVVLSAENGMGASFKATIANKSGEVENWTLSNLPAWLTADVTEGILTPASTQKISFTVAPSVPVGNHDEVVYLSGNNNISEALHVRVNVRAEAPAWSVDATKFDYVATMAGQVFIDNKICENPETRVAAFINGQCTGLAQVEYVPTRDAYYVFMNIYGNDNEKEKPISFKVWDASTGVIYSKIVLNGQPETVFNFGDNKEFGSVKAPTQLATSAEIEQVVALNQGWNWLSFYVNAETTGLEALRASGKLVKVTDMKNIADQMGGELKQTAGDRLYKVKMSAPAEITVTGTEAGNNQVMSNGHNWIGGPHMLNLSLNEAFASIATEDDLVKNMYGFAIYNGNVWEGSLKVIEPGKGYVYKSVAEHPANLVYPEAVSSGANSRLLNWTPAREIKHFAGIASVAENYSNNMTMVACVTRGGELVADAEVAVYVGAECRTVAVTDEQGRLFLTIPGDEDGERLRFVVCVDGQEYLVSSASSLFTADAHYGALSSPVSIDIDSATGIELGTQMGTSEKAYYGIDGRALGTDRKDIKRTGVYILREGNQTKKVLLK